jgi:hypothetical protein
MKSPRPDHQDAGAGRGQDPHARLQVARGRAARATATPPAASAPQLLEKHPTEYTANYTAPLRDPRQAQIRHPDHPDIFNFQSAKTEQSTYKAAHNVAAAVHSVRHFLLRDFGGSSPDENPATKRPHEDVCRVKATAVKNRPSHAFEGQSSYRANFVNFFPKPTEGPANPGSKTETFCQVLSPPPKPVAVSLPFEIGTRDPATEVAVSSEYREKFVDFANPQVARGSGQNRTVARPRPLRALWDGAPAC